jgi:hypothetical protein
MQQHKPGQKGSIFAYILIAILLLGVLIMTLTGGPQKSTTTVQLDELTNLIRADLMQISAAINECVLNNSTPLDLNADGTVDSTDNPNPTFPLYNTTFNAGTSYGGTGTAIANITCPGAAGAPTAMPLIFNNMGGRALRTLADTSLYTVNYLNNATEGVQIRITRTASSPLWTEAISRLNSQYSQCKAAAVAPTGAGTCANGCFYLWVLRQSTSDSSIEAGCP